MSQILLIETDTFVASSIIGLLELKDFKVDWQVDPQAAMQVMDEKPIDMVIMDLILAGRSGIEFLYELRSYPEWKNLPVILHSSVPPREVYTCVAGLEQLQVAAYHYKSTTLLSELVSSVEACLQPSRV